VAAGNAPPSGGVAVHPLRELTPAQKAALVAELDAIKYKEWAD